MAMEKYLYFRKVTAAGDDDDADGSLMYPVSALRGMCMGTAAVTGAITEDEDAFSLFFTPMRNTQGSSADDAKDDNPDVIVVAITTDNNAKVVMKALVAAINGGPHSEGVIEVFDGVAGTKVHADIEGLTILTNDND